MSISPLPENILPAGADTLLIISGLGGFEYQARGLVQTLVPIAQSKQQVRTINGDLRDISNHVFRKYASEITCTDLNAPPFDGLFPGDTVDVECAVTLCYRNGNAGSPNKEQVSGSSYTRGNFTFYRPVLTMMVMEWSTGFEEWKSDYQWKLNLEEV